MTKKIESKGSFFPKNICGNFSSNVAWYVVLIGCTTILLAFSLPGLITNYSFWIDELYTVQFISGSWAELLTEHVLPDTNPPLYFAIAKIWISMTGLTEGSLRSLSLFFSSATIIYFWCQCRRQQTFGSATALILISTNAYFLYYTQEARSYAALILLASVLTFESSKFINHTNNRRYLLSPKLLIIITSIALSITHYFGLIFAFTSSISRMFFARKKEEMLIEIKVIIAMLIWPVLHLGVYGYLNKSQLERIALEPQPWWAPIQSFSISNLPYINSGLLIIDTFYTIFTGALIILSLAITLKAKREKDSKDITTINNLVLTLLILTIGLSGISSVNQLTPVSTYRNFVIFIAPTSIMLGSCLDIMLSKSRKFRQPFKRTLSATIYIFITIQILISLKIGQLNLEQKIAYGPNYKLLAQAINKYDICKNGCLLINNREEYPIQLGPLSYYFDGNELISSAKQKKIKNDKDMPLIGYQLSETEIEKIRMRYRNKHLIKVCQKRRSRFKNYSIILADNSLLNNISPKHLCPE